MKRIRWFTVLAALCLAVMLPAQSVQAAGFVQDAAGVRYQNEDGSFLSDNWVQVGESIYHLDGNGYVQTGWIQVGNLWYLMDASGICTNPAGTAVPPAGASVASGTPAAAATDQTTAATTPAAGTAADNIYAAAGWVPFATDDANVLNAGIAAGLVGFDGARFWAAPQYAQTISAPAPQTDTPAQAQVPTLVWLSATGTKYHSINHCGNMNPARARQVTLEEARRAGYGKCSKCF